MDLLGTARDLPLHARTHLSEDKAEFPVTASTQHRAVDCEWVAGILREDATFQLCSNVDGHETCDAIAPATALIIMVSCGRQWFHALPLPGLARGAETKF